MTTSASIGRQLPRPQVLFFDLGDTLIRAHPSWAGVYRLGLVDAGIEADEAELEQALRDASQAGGWALDGPFEATEEASFERVKQFDAAVLASLGYPGLPDEVFRRVEAAFLARSAWYVFPDVLPAIEALDAAGVRMAVISNWLWGGHELLHSLELARHFEALVISARVGFNKPHPGIFAHALAAMQVAPVDAVHVGDSYGADVVGARGVGITPVLIDRRQPDKARVREEYDDPDLPVIGDLLELLDLLGVARPVAQSRSA